MMNKFTYFLYGLKSNSPPYVFIEEQPTNELAQQRARELQTTIYEDVLVLKRHTAFLEPQEPTQILTQNLVIIDLEEEILV